MCSSGIVASCVVMLMSTSCHAETAIICNISIDPYLSRTEKPKEDQVNFFESTNTN